ncbi:MAG: hypothetical protein V1908_00260 [Candidatus Peregrinibacteria bacterium]
MKNNQEKTRRQKPHPRLQSTEQWAKTLTQKQRRAIELLFTVPLTRREIKRMLWDVIHEQELVESYGAESWKEAMRDEDAFYAFLTDPDLRGIEREFSPDHFAEMLKVAATSSRDHAQVFFDSANELREAIENKKALAEALAAARTFLRKRRRA